MLARFVKYGRLKIKYNELSLLQIHSNAASFRGPLPTNYSAPLYPVCIHVPFLCAESRKILRICSGTKVKFQLHNI